MKNIVLTFFLSLLIVLGVIAQPSSSHRGSTYCHSHKLAMDNTTLMKMKSPGSPLHSFDVLNYSLDLDLMENFSTPYPYSFGAKLIIKFRVDSTLNTLVLNAINTSLTIDSVSMAAVSYTHDSNLLSLTLDRTYSPGEIAEVRIAYHHNNVVDGAINVSNGFFFTDCEPEGARKWFPCYDSPSDKATVSLTAKMPSNVKLASNGRLEDSIPGTNSITYHWISRDPVATYLVVVTAKVNYQLDIVNWTNPNTSEVIPIRFYFNQGEDPTPIENIIGDMTSFYSSEFGDHPFEKNGFATLNNQFSWGGMENQTLTSLCPDCWDEWLTAHEFAHQWFGDMITCATWADIFLNEGFATWSEAHWTEHAYGYASYKNEIEGNADYYLAANPGWAISNPEWAVTTPDVGTLFNYAITYMKGSCVLHQLRYVLGDSLYFAGIKAYATDTVDFKYKSATIPDFRDKMEDVTGQDLDWFFDGWIYQPNHPRYKNVYSIKQLEEEKWEVLFTAKQQQAALYYWQMPLEVKINFMDLTDTLIRVFNSFNGEIFSFQFDKQPANLEFDPGNHILLKQGYTIVGEPDAIKNNSHLVTVYPSPASGDVEIRYYLDIPSVVTLELYDESGRMILNEARGVSNEGEDRWKLSASLFSKGIYYVRIMSKNSASSTRFIHY